jgi:hypothetical protein
MSQNNTNTTATKMPLFRCERCGKLNYERKKRALAVRILHFLGPRYKCSVCGSVYYQEHVDELVLQSQDSSQGSSLKGLVLDDAITITETHSGNDIIIPSHRLCFIKTLGADKELWGVAYANKLKRPTSFLAALTPSSAQKVIGKLKGNIRFAIPDTGQILTLDQKSIETIKLDYSLPGSFAQLFDSLGDAAEAVAKDIDETPAEELQQRVQGRADKIRLVKEAVRDSGLVSVSDADVKQRQAELEMAQSETKIQQEKLEQEQTRKELANLRETQADVEQENLKAKVEKIQQLTQERDRIMAGIDDEDMKKKVKIMYDDKILAVQDV